MTIDLYAASGEKVKSLFDGLIQPGVYSLRVDTNDLQAGSYFYQIAINGQPLQPVKAVKIR